MPPPPVDLDDPYPALRELYELADLLLAKAAVLHARPAPPDWPTDLYDLFCASETGA